MRSFLCFMVLWIAAVTWGGSLSLSSENGAHAVVDGAKPHVSSSSESIFFTKWGYGTYTLTASPGSPYVFVADATTISAGEPNGTNSVKKTIANTNTAVENFSLGMRGKMYIPGGEEGSPIDWSASINTKFFYIKSNQTGGDKDITVPEGTSVTYTAYEGASSVKADWEVYGAPPVKGETSIIFSRSWWDVPGWFDASMGTLKPGNYRITAKAAGKDTPSDNGIMTVVGASFCKSSSHPYSFDDFTGWTKNAGDYYVGQTGRCAKSYVAVKHNTTGTVYLDLIPSPIKKDIEITENTNSIEEVTPQTTRASTSVSFKGVRTWYSDEGDMDARLDGTILATVRPCTYNPRTIKVLFVGVNGTYGDANYSYFEQAIVHADVTYRNYAVTEMKLPGESTPISINRSTLWTKPMYEKLRDDFYSANSDVLSYDYVQFQLQGNMPVDAGIADDIPARDSWVGQEEPKRTYAHELGHCLGLSHRNKYDGSCAHDNCDRDALMCQGNHASGVNATKLRKAEWDAIH